jgi:hypothetical protein
MIARRLHADEAGKPTPRVWRCMRPLMGALAVALLAAPLPAKADVQKAKPQIAAQQKKADAAKDIIGDVALAACIGLVLLGLQQGLASHSCRHMPERRC